MDTALARTRVVITIDRDTSADGGTLAHTGATLYSQSSQWLLINTARIHTVLVVYKHYGAKR